MAEVANIAFYTSRARPFLSVKFVSQYNSEKNSARHVSQSRVA